MIIQTGMRTDIPAFYAEWFANRINEGYVMVRNPYQPLQVTKYSLNSEVADTGILPSLHIEEKLSHGYRRRKK